MEKGMESKETEGEEISGDNIKIKPSLLWNFS